MRKVRLIVLKSHVENLVKDLHEAGVVDIRKVKTEGMDEGRPLAAFDEVSANLLKLRSALALMESAVGKKKHEPSLIPGEKAMMECRSLAFEERLRALSAEISGLSEAVKSLDAKAAAVRKCMDFRGVDFSKLSSRTVAFRVGEVGAAKVPRLREGISKANGEMITGAGKGAALVIFERRHEQKVEGLLSEAGFSDIEIPQYMKTPAETLDDIQKEKESSVSRLAALRKELAELSRANMGKVQDLVHSLEVLASRAEVPSRFAESRKTYMIEGWILDDDFPGIGPLAEKHGAAHEDAGFDAHHEMPPTVLDNPEPVREFEFITKSYSLPRYNEIDPTVPYFIGLSIIYGMIIGDVVYGLISMVFAYWIIRNFGKSELMRPIATIWLIAGIPTIIWGLVFDEWMGLSHRDFLNWLGSFAGVTILQSPLYTGFHRVEELSMLILATLFVGMIHLAFGLALGAINEWNHSKKHSLAKIGWLVLEIGIAIGLLFATGFVDPGFISAAVAFGVAGAITIVATEGATGAVELPGFAGNILSYSRIAVIGIVGVILAEILNEFLRPTPAQGLMALVLLPVFLALHFANCIIAMFEALVQGGRLNIFEFRTKAIGGGGTVFAPFALYSKKL